MALHFKFGMSSEAVFLENRNKQEINENLI
jgi:hypothetical protein